jgi:uncharacterized protein
MPNLSFSTFLRPGVRVVESTAGFRVLELASFQAVYMVGSASVGDILEPTLVKSLTEFNNAFPGSPSEASVRLFFRNHKEGILYFVRSGIAERVLVSVDTVAAGTYTLSVQGVNVSYTATGTDTAATIVAGLIDAVNLSTAAGQVTAIAATDPDEFLIIGDTPSVVLVVNESDAKLSTTVATPLSPTARDYVYAIENTFDVEEDWAQGFVLAPEAFQRLTLQADRLSVAAALENLARTEGYDWASKIDCGATVDTVAELQAERALYSSPQGHSAYYAPYVVDLEGQIVPPSAAIAAIATRRFQREGIQQPAAGAKYPIQGVQDVAVRFTGQDQDVLNPLGINLIRRLRNKGVVIWAMRTLSADSFYRFTVTRIIMNVLNGTLRSGFDFEVFQSIDGKGILLSLLDQTARSVCRRLWRQGALFGNEESDAFEVVCNFENNPDDELEQGHALVEVYAAPSPAAEKILINSVRVAIGQVQSAAQAGRR